PRRSGDRRRTRRKGHLWSWARLRGLAGRNRNPPEVALSSCRARSVLLDRLDLELEAGLLADQDASAFESGVPREAEVLAVDLGGGREAGPPAAPRVGRPAVVLDVQYDRPGHTVDGEVTLQAEAA